MGFLEARVELSTFPPVIHLFLSQIGTSQPAPCLVLYPTPNMKHTYSLGFLTLIAASASAVALPTVVAPSTQFASNVSLTYGQESTSGVSGHQNGWSLGATGYLGGSDLFVQGATSVGGDLGNGQDLVQLGYRFKNVGGIADAALAIGSDERYTLSLHRALGNGFGAWLTYVRQHNDDQYGATISKSLTHDYSLDLSYTRVEVSNVNSDVWGLGVRRKF